ncbi:cohesin loading factor Ssl3 [Ancistrocladus abbreviatus]
MAVRVVRLICPAAVCTMLFALYCGLDPFHHSTIHGFPHYKSYYIPVPDPSEVDTLEDPQNLLQKSEIRWLNQVLGPESVTFDPQGRGPYAGVADGRIVFWTGRVWTTFAYTSPNRSEVCTPKPTVREHIKYEHICGRPLGLRFHKKTGYMYIADAYYGLLKVGPKGGLATQLATEAEGIPINFANDLDIDAEGNVYFSDTSRTYRRRDFMQCVFAAEPTGRLLKFDPVTNKTTVLVRGLQFVNGVSLSKNDTFFVFVEGSIGRLRRYWLKGDKTGTVELFAYPPGHPDNVRTNARGEFLAAVHCRRNRYFNLLAKYPKLRDFVLGLPIPALYQYKAFIGGRFHAMVAKYSPEGKLLQVWEDREGKVVRAVSEVDEHDGKLWMGSVLMPFIGVYDLNSN